MTITRTRTRTRTRTQTTLAKLAEMVANVHGELAFVDELLSTRRGLNPQVSGLQSRHATLTQQREALYTTLRQFNPDLVPESIGAQGAWMTPYGRKKTKATLRRYEAVMSVRL